jgi:hypothetical protein
MQMMLKKALLLILSLCSLICFFLFYQLYWMRTFDSEGRSFDPIEGVVYQESSFVWGLVGCALLSLLFFLQRKKP